MGKKKLDELFQEKFNDFEQVPDERVWQAIETSLDKKKKRVIPLWWKLGGIAAILAIGFFAINPFADSTEGEPALTDTEQQSSDSLERNKTKATKILDMTEAEENQLTETNSQDSGKTIVGSDSNNPSKIKSSDQETDAKFLPSTKEKSQLTSSEKDGQQKGTYAKIDSDSNTLIADVPEGTSNKNNDAKDNLERQKENKNIRESVAEQRADDKSISEQATEKAIAQQEKSADAIKNESGGLKKGIEDTGIAQNDREQNENKVDKEAIEEVKKKSIFEEIAKQEEAEIAENQIGKRWSAGPSVAPVYFDAFGEGSPVHSILVPNSKSGETNLSYGLSVAYKINDRLSVRSGLHKVNYGYDTDDIEFSSSLDGAVTDQMDNINYAATARNLVVRSKAGSTAVSVNDSANEQAFDASSANSSIGRNGTMSQQFGYLEVPVELNYALVDRKVGINLIGGFSSLFLVNNAVSLTSGNETTEMGEANNVNDINFSTNIGLGIDYNLSPRVQLNIEPLFKYQLNTFSEVDGTFNPFSVGIYSGLTFKF